MDDEVDRPEPPSAKVVTALLREARSLSRRADKLSSTAAVVDDPTTQHLVAEACTSMEQLVHHLMVVERAMSAGANVKNRNNSSRPISGKPRSRSSSSSAST